MSCIYLISGVLLNYYFAGSVLLIWLYELLHLCFVIKQPSRSISPGQKGFLCWLVCAILYCCLTHNIVTFLRCHKNILHILVLPVLPVLPVRAPGHLQLDLLAVFDVTFEGLIDQQSVTEDSTRLSFFEHAS